MDIDNAKMDGRIRKALDAVGPGLAAPAGTLASVLAGGSVLVRAKPGATRHAVLMAALASRLAAEPGLRALVVAPGDRDVSSLKGACDSIVDSIGKRSSTIGRDSFDADSDVSIGSMDAVASHSASGALDARAFGLVALSDVDSMVDAASVVMMRRALGAALPGRRVVAFSAEPGPSHRAIVRDLAGTVEEISLEAEGEREKSIPSDTWNVSADDKIRLFLGLASPLREKPAVVFCNMRDTAESVARLLKGEGFRVEYILGNLPRKRSILDSVIAGNFDILVLTDEGANGLPGGWARILFNWDLPLEGEPYLARIAHLDPSFERAHIHNFACERYSVGLQAIERVLGSPLPAVVADETVMAPSKAKVRADVSARRDDRQPEHRGSPEQRDRGGQYDGRNARAIQADIAAITGGFSLNDKKPLAPGQGPSRKKRGRKAPESKRETVATVKKRETARPKPAKNSPPAARQRKKGGGPRLADPYSVSMEERLRLYRERYGNGVPQENQRAGSGRTVRPGDGKTAATGEAPAKAPDTTPGTAPVPKGILGALKGIFSARNDPD